MFRKTVVLFGYFLQLATLQTSFSIPASKVVSHHTDIDSQIKAYENISQKIINFVTKGEGKHQTFNQLAAMTDKFGNRLVGSETLESVIDYMLNQFKANGLENVHGEEVTNIPHWIRGQESATMLEPRNYKMSILGLGGSVGTTADGITAEVLVVHSFDELQARAAEAIGKIVVFDQVYINYGVSVAYRDYGAYQASKVGGVASLIRSIAPFSINSPHTGWQYYKNGTAKIPTACITIEDAEMLSRIAARGEKIVIHLYMEAQNLPRATSRNTVGEIVGTKYPDQVVLVSGHLDSWDVGQGAMDDGGGAFISWQVLSIMKQLNLRAKRTVRVVLWTGEEVGLVGSYQYYNAHKSNISNYDFVMESDIGTFKPNGLKFSGNDEAFAIMKKVMTLVKPINASTLYKKADGGDVSFWIKNGVPGGSLSNDNAEYFYFHHSNGDTITVENPDDLDLCTALWAVVTYVVADMDEMLPR